MDGYVEPNHMCAIMGPSGCGKTTLLDTLAGRLASSAAHTGDISVNGHKTALSFGKAAYVTQDDVLIGALTVFETILYSAKLRLPQASSSRQLRRRCHALSWPTVPCSSLQCWQPPAARRCLAPARCPAPVNQPRHPRPSTLPATGHGQQGEGCHRG